MRSLAILRLTLAGAELIDGAGLPKLIANGDQGHAERNSEPDVKQGMAHVAKKQRERRVDQEPYEERSSDCPPCPCFPPAERSTDNGDNGCHPPNDDRSEYAIDELDVVAWRAVSDLAIGWSETQAIEDLVADETAGDHQGERIGHDTGGNDEKPSIPERVRIGRVPHSGILTSPSTSEKRSPRRTSYETQVLALRQEPLSPLLEPEERHLGNFVPIHLWEGQARRCFLRPRAGR